MIPIQPVLTPHTLIFTIHNNKRPHEAGSTNVKFVCSGHKKSYMWQHLNKPN